MTNADGSYVTLSEVRKILGIGPMSAEVLADSAYDGVAAAIDRNFDFMLNPWKRPHRNPFPMIDPVPRFTRWQQRATEARRRVVGAVDVLRHGVVEESDDW